MSVNRNLQVAVAIGLLFIIGIFVYINYEYEQKLETGFGIDSKLVPVKRNLVKVVNDPSFQDLSRIEQSQKAVEVLDQLPPEYQNLKRRYQLAMASVPDIEFHGRVIDQYKQPVAGAEVIYIGASGYLAEGSGGGGVKTDKEGYFEINGTGISLLLSDIRHPEVDQVIYRSPNNHTEETQIHFSARGDERGISPNWHNYDSKENAYIIHVWRRGKYEGATRDILMFNAPGDGRIFTLRLTEIDERKRVVDGQATGDLRISCTKSRIQHNGSYGDWRITITPVDGGIQGTNDLYQNIAPENGYVPSLLIDKRKSDKNYVPHLIEQKYYFSAHNGKMYGSVVVSFRPFVRKEFCFVDMV